MYFIYAEHAHTHLPRLKYASRSWLGSLRKRWIRSRDTLASRVPLMTQGKLLRGTISMPTRARVVNTCNGGGEVSLFELVSCIHILIVFLGIS